VQGRHNHLEAVKGITSTSIATKAVTASTHRPANLRVRCDSNNQEDDHRNDIKHSSRSYQECKHIDVQVQNQHLYNYILEHQNQFVGSAADDITTRFTIS